LALIGSVIKKVKAVQATFTLAVFRSAVHDA